MSEAPSLPAPTTPRRPASGGPTRLRAVTRRVPRRPASHTADDDAAGEPPLDEARPVANTPLSRAVGVMLLLHVIAFGGVLAFGYIKEGPSKAAGVRPSKSPPARGVPAKGEVSEGAAAALDNAPTPYPAIAVTTPPAVESGHGPGRMASTTGPALSRVEADAVRLIESAGPNPLAPGERAYVVGRGETVQTIAQKLRVEPAALLRLNHIDDPRRIQPGQRLRVPPVPGRSRS